MARTEGFVFKFSTEMFDYKGEIPVEANAGNRFYGRDVAEFLCDHLARDGLELGYIDEDWGWLVTGTMSGKKSLDVAIYNHGVGDVMHAPPVATNTWSLLVEMFESRKLLGFIPKRHAIACEPWLLQLLEMALTIEGIHLIEAAKGNEPF